MNMVPGDLIGVLRPEGSVPRPERSVPTNDLGTYRDVHAAQIQAGRLEDPADMTLVLAVASLTPTVTNEIEQMGWTLVPLGAGYARIDGPMYAMYVVVIDEVAPAEHDEFLAIFSHALVVNREAQQWFTMWLSKGSAMQKAHELEGYDEMFQKLLDSTPIERRLAGLTPGEILVAILSKEVLATSSVEVLRLLPESYVNSLPAHLQAAIRERLRAGGSGSGQGSGQG